MEHQKSKKPLYMSWLDLIPTHDPPSCANSWTRLLARPRNPIFNRGFVIKGKRKHSRSRDVLGLRGSKSIKKEKTGRIRKVRRARGVTRLRKLPGVSFKTIGASAAIRQCPVSLFTFQQCVVNTLSEILPIEGRTNIFGSWHAIILVGVFYRYGNLTWIVLNRANCRLYTSAHFIADAIHLFQMMRGDLRLEESQRRRKWHRQGFNDVTCIYKTQTEYERNVAFQLQKLPRAILQFGPSQHTLRSGQEFINGGGAQGNFLATFQRGMSRPPGFDPVIGHLVDGTRGWKVFNNTVNGRCLEKARRVCPHSAVVDRLKFVQGFTLSKASPHIMNNVPSSLHAKCTALVAHFTPFIDYVKAHPTVLFFPTGDTKI